MKDIYRCICGVQVEENGQMHARCSKEFFGPSVRSLGSCNECGLTVTTEHERRWWSGGIWHLACVPDDLKDCRICHELEDARRLEDGVCGECRSDPELMAEQTTGALVSER